MVRALVLRADGRLGEVQRVLLLGDHRRQCDKVRNDSDYIDDVHYVAEEIEFVGTREEADREFEREPDDAYRLDEEERVRDVGHLVLFDLCAVGGRVEDFVVFELRQSFQAEDDDGQKDDEHGYDGDDSGRLRTLRVLEQQPHLSLELVRRQRLLFFLDEPLVLPATKRILQIRPSSRRYYSLIVFLDRL